MHQGSTISPKEEKDKGAKRIAMEHETTKLKGARFIREVNYMTWLSNVVMMKKNNGKWRMFVNYTDLNKAYLKDSYLLLSIDQLNVRATYQRLMDKVFAEELMPTPTSAKSAKSLSKFLPSPPILAKPIKGHDLCLYPTMFEHAISVVVVQEQGKSQDLVYCINKVLQDAETRYQMIEKLVLALITSAQRLQPYFHSHMIVVRTNHPIRQVLWKPKLAGRMTVWSIKLFEFSLKYEPRGAIKFQALVDFIVEMTLCVDSSSNLKGDGVSTTLKEPGQVVLKHSLKFDFKISNNQAEYKALVVGLDLTLKVRARRILYHSDSQLVTKHLKDSY
ncbi:hypothetical protein CR513_31590, partial [Mucuna pruriens]